MGSRAATVALALWSAAAQGQPRDAGVPEAPLRLSFQPRSRARYASRSVQRASAGGREARAETRVSFTLDTGAVSADGEAERTLRVTDASLSAANLSPAVRAAALQALRGASVRFRETPRGEVLERALPVDVAPAARGVLDAVLGGFDAVLPVLPEGPVRRGDRWRRSRELRAAPTPGVSATIRSETEYTLRELRPDGAAVLDLRVTLTAPPGATLAGVPMRGEGSATGEAVLDLRGGLLREASLRGEFTARLTVRGRELALPSRFEDELRLVGPPRR